MWFSPNLASLEEESQNSPSPMPSPQGFAFYTLFYPILLDFPFSSVFNGLKGFLIGKPWEYRVIRLWSLMEKAYEWM
jgi:hypothetical protein